MPAFKPAFFIDNQLLKAKKIYYIKINNINYKFTKDVYIPQNMTFNSYEKTETIQFIDRINCRKENYNWYGDYRKTI